MSINDLHHFEGDSPESFTSIPFRITKKTEASCRAIPIAMLVFTSKIVVNTRIAVTLIEIAMFTETRNLVLFEISMSLPIVLGSWHWDQYIRSL